MICFEVQVEDLVVLEQIVDFKQKIFQIYFLHFLGDDFQDEVQDKHEENKKEKTWSMTCTLI